MRESKSVANDLENGPNALEQVQLSEVRLRQVIDTDARLVQSRRRF